MMSKKLLSFILAMAVTMTMSTGFTLNTATAAVSHSSGITVEESEQINPISLDNTFNQLHDKDSVIQSVETFEFEGIDSMENTISIPQKKVSSRNAQTRSGSVINDSYGISQGTLTEENTLDYYLFSTIKDSLSVSKIVTNNSNYTMILGLVDYTTGQISLTSYGAVANQQYAINLPKGDYAWIIQSQNATYGDSYKLQYNYSLPMNADDVLYISDDYQKIYSFSYGAFKINNQYQNLDYKYDLHWQTELSSGTAWHTEKIWLENATVTDVIHMGGFQYKHGSNYITYPNTIVFNVGEGGTFTHYLDQNPPRVFHDYKDMAGRETPRAIDSFDLELYGSHYLVYDLDTDTVKEFVSGLSRQWSGTPDKTDPKLI